MLAEKQTQTDTHTRSLQYSANHTAGGITVFAVDQGRI